MKLDKLSNYHRGWIIGNFDPSIIKTSGFEVGLLSHHKGEKWPKHYHQYQEEINVLISGKMSLNGEIILPNDIFILEPGEIAEPEFLEDCLILVIKHPSIPGDKHVVE